MVDTRLPFGASASVEAFHRLSQAVARAMHRRGFTHVAAYLDDFCLACPTKSGCTDGMFALIRLLRDLGFAINWAKVVPPTKSLTFLGVQIDSAAGSLSVPLEKRREVLSLIQCTLLQRSVSKKQLQSLIGKLSWVCQCHRQASPFLREIIGFCERLQARHNRTAVRGCLRDLLRWWESALPHLPDRCLWPQLQPLAIIETDACDVGGAAIVHLADGRSSWIYTRWASDWPEVRDRHINFKELAAALTAISTFAPQLTGHHVVVLSDSEAACGMLRKWSNS
jgi:hypothetical protein